MNRTPYPDWVLSHKRKGVEIRHFQGRYYLYKISSFWDKEKQRTRKKTECLLGRILPEGLVAIQKEELSKEQSKHDKSNLSLHHTDTDQEQTDSKLCQLANGDTNQAKDKQTKETNPAYSIEKFYEKQHTMGTITITYALKTPKSAA